MGKNKAKASSSSKNNKKASSSSRGGHPSNDDNYEYSIQEKKRLETLSHHDDNENQWDKKSRKKKSRGNHSNKLQDEDFQQMNQQLEPYGLYLKKVTGDGNCQFRSVSDQLYGDQNQYQKIRIGCVEYMMNNPDMFAPFVCDESFEDYCKNMKKDTEWGDNLTLQAISVAFNVNIRVHQLAKPSFDIVNYNDPNSKLIQLSYHLGEHYNSVHYMSESVKQLYQTAAKNSGSQNSQISKKEEIIVQSTGCTDLTLIRNTLQDFNQDMDSVIDFLCQMKYYSSNSDHWYDNDETINTNSILQESKNTRSIGSSSSHIAASSSHSIGSSSSSQTSHGPFQSLYSSHSTSGTDNDHLLDSCFDLVMSTIGYDSGHDIELVRDLITSNQYNAETVIDMLLSLSGVEGHDNHSTHGGSSSGNSGSSGSSSSKSETTLSSHQHSRNTKNHDSQKESSHKSKKLTKREKREAKQREKLAQVQALHHRSLENHTELDEEAIKKFESIQI
ncbi:hypothetical protein C9374_008132 [Naegleria lovaniensis]|uniref:OTU domain-containing protein n=1 Tax=Naegleria lovaniensis TaxID=51637 RepID=A0AA88KI43_NAELO|nr:uncharacterized protein C9374_008132 [Naegleria lovaniensis]KAG2378493.1 hypothetical protein C9374_008132 [Naegleria lovaniensis]